VKPRLAGGVIGIVFGITLCWSGMSDPGVIRHALLFQRAYLFLMFASAVLVAAIGLQILRRRTARALLTDAPVSWTRERPGRRHVVGSLLFGVGWGLADACPGPIAAQVGAGVPWALFTMAGAAAGVYLFLRRGQAETEPASDVVGPVPAAPELLSPIPSRAR
jgi:uncharacterized membrane protein YedE/YeeE